MTLLIGISQGSDSTLETLLEYSKQKITDRFNFNAFIHSWTQKQVALMKLVLRVVPSSAKEAGVL